MFIKTPYTLHWYEICMCTIVAWFKPGAVQEFTKGYNARKVISKVYASFVLQDGCHSLTWDPSVTWKINEIFWSLETIMWIIKIIKIKCFYPPQILNEHWWIYSCLQIPPRENWFQYVCRVYATAINFPCIITLDLPVYCNPAT